MRRSPGSPRTQGLLAWMVPAGTIPNDQKAFDMSATCEVLGVGYGGRNFASAFDVTDNVGEELWRDYTAGNVQTVAIMGDDLVIGGHFSQVNHERRIRIASVDLATGALTSWNPDVDGQFYGPWDLLVTADQRCTSVDSSHRSQGCLSTSSRGSRTSDAVDRNCSRMAPA